MSNMAILALDLGQRRIGMAINEVGSVVTELKTLPWTDADELISIIGLLVQERNIVKIVLGQPRAGSQLEELVVKLSDRLSGVEICLLDETLTTKEAERQLSGSIGTKDTDAYAARLLLEQYLSDRGHL
jgi:putative transcription antitermination factor YqgF